MDLQYFISHWESVRAGLIETINKFREEELDYEPFPASRSVRRLMLHMAQEENGEFNYGITRTLPELPAEYNEGDYPTRASILSLLAAVHAQSTGYLETLAEDDLGKVINTPWGASY